MVKHILDFYYRNCHSTFLDEMLYKNKSWNSIVYALGLFQNEECNFYLLNAANRFENELVGGINNQVELAQVVNKRDQKRTTIVISSFC